MSESANENKAIHSFAILAYGESPYIEECIQSLLNQKTGSKIYITTPVQTDFLKNLAAKYNLPLLLNSSSSGIGSDWNFALSKCETPYLTLAHQDDIYLPEFSASALSHKRLQESLIVFTDYSELIENRVRKFSYTQIVKRIILKPFSFSSFITSKTIKKFILSFGSPIACPSVTYNLVLLSDFQFSNNYSINLDWDAWLRLADKNGGFIYVKKRVVQHRLHKDSETSRGIRNQKRQKEDLLIFNSLWSKPLAKLFATLYKLSYKNYI